MAMLEVKDLEVYYGMIQAIKGISFEVNQGCGATARPARCASGSTPPFRNYTQQEAAIIKNLK